ncbi:uncharacterized protein LOC124366663 [Homalodisca vitripennis]|uniref:uncharacterized protein LOC124366663 n=1 Tax=Homalodisca vitripennis TaxID=197043 RepID=UPI001EEA5412|nr:uncharacterized protein LOC124366663 [Homalodisca vitripennis]
MDTVGLEDFNSIDRALGTTLSSQIDFFYPAFLCLVATQLLSYLRFLKANNWFYIFNVVITSLSMVQTAFMKHMVSKRIICIQEKAAEETQNVLDLVQTTRRVHNLNKKINEVFSLRVANAIFIGFTFFLHCLLSHWRVYGLHKEIECFESISPFYASLFQSHIITELIFLAGISSKITSTVDSLSWDTNRRISFGKHSMEHRKKRTNANMFANAQLNPVECHEPSSLLQISAYIEMDLQ